jgi:hypothetical protein
VSILQWFFAPASKTITLAAWLENPTAMASGEFGPRHDVVDFYMPSIYPDGSKWTAKGFVPGVPCDRNGYIVLDEPDKDKFIVALIAAGIPLDGQVVPHNADWAD